MLERVDKPLWTHLQGHDELFHVVPVFARPHILCMSCWCSPKVEHTGVATHFANDLSATKHDPRSPLQ